MRQSPRLHSMFFLRRLFPTELVEHILSYISLDEVFVFVERFDSRFSLEDYQQINAMRSLIQFNYTNIPEFTLVEPGVSLDWACSSEIARIGRDGYYTADGIYRIISEEDGQLFREVGLRNLTFAFLFAGVAYRVSNSSIRFLAKRKMVPDYTQYQCIYKRP